jgi:hypothetical protein
MQMSLKTFRDEYLDMLLHFLWREWTALGVAGQTREPVHHVVDPEALVLLTCSVGRYDQRLFDEMLDWLIINGRFLNVQRMATMLGHEPFTGSRVVGAVSGWMASVGNPVKWNRLAHSCSKQRPCESLFRLADGSPLPEPGERDPVFLSHGFVRNPVTIRGNALPFSPDALPCLLLQLRALFGVNARCEVLVYLALNRSGHPGAVARETGFSQKAVHDAMTDMACSGVLQSVRTGRERVYKLSSRGQLFLAGEGPLPGWINWPVLLSSGDAIWGLVETLCTEKLDHDLETSEIMLAMKPLFVRFAKASWMPALSAPQGLPMLRAFRDAFQSVAG